MIDAISRIRKFGGVPVEMIWEFENGTQAVYDFRFGRLSVGKNGKAVESITTVSIDEVTNTLIRFNA